MESLRYEFWVPLDKLAYWIYIGFVVVYYKVADKYGLIV